MGSESGELVEVVTALSKEQQEFLQQCEEEFADRFSEKDNEFQKVKDLPESMPPIIDPWYSRAPRNFDWSRNNNRGRRPYDDRSNRDRERDRDRERELQNHRNVYRYRDRRNRPY